MEGNIEFIIDSLGRLSILWEEEPLTAIYALGYIRIRLVNFAVFIGINPNLVNTITLAATAYKISDLNSLTINPDCLYR